MYAQAVKLRYELFFKAFHLPESIVVDEWEAISIHVATDDTGSLVAYGRLSELETGVFKISQVVVRPELQRQGHASRLVTVLVNRAMTVGATRIELNAQVSARALYKRLGFFEAGPVYPSKTTGLPHVRMLRACVG